jgi:hypothetical protein
MASGSHGRVLGRRVSKVHKILAVVCRCVQVDCAGTVETWESMANSQETTQLIMTLHGGHDSQAKKSGVQIYSLKSSSFSFKAILLYVIGKFHSSHNWGSVPQRWHTTVYVDCDRQTWDRASGLFCCPPADILAVVHQGNFCTAKTKTKR